MKIFISHIKDDEELANNIKKWIESSFLGKIEIFVSSDPGDIVVGDQWFKDIESFLLDANLVIVLITKNSVNRRWINFEAGAGWIKKIPVIPVCFNGIAKNLIPSPLSVFQAIDLHHPKFSEIFFSAIAKHLSFPKSPNINYNKMNNDLLKATSDFFEEDELGYLDHIESMETGFKAMSEIWNSITSEMEIMRTETENYTEIVNSEKTQSSQGSTRYLQKESKKLAKKIDKFTEIVSDSNVKYVELVQKVVKNINFIFNFSHPQNKDDLNQLIGAVDVIKNVIAAAAGTKNAMSSLSNTMNSVPKFERHLNRALKKGSSELDILVDNLDSNIGMFKRAEQNGK